MKHRALIIILAGFACALWAEPAASPQSSLMFPIKPIVYAIPYEDVDGLYPVPFPRQIFVDPYPTGRLQFIIFKPEGRLEQKILPFEGGDVRKLLFTDNNKKMYLCLDRLIWLFEMEKFKILSEYPEKIEHISYTYFDLRLVDAANQKIATFDSYYGWASPDVVGGGEVEWCQYTIHDLANFQIIKRLPLANKGITSPNAFVHNGFIFRENDDAATKWRAIDNSLKPSDHPVLKILNENLGTFSGGPDKLIVLDAFKMAIACGTLNIRYTNALYVASWAADPQFAPLFVPGEEKATVLLDHFTGSPSGKWLFVCMDDNERPRPRNYLIRIDPDAVNGYLPPFKLPLEGEPQAVSWTTEPEGLVIAMSQRLIWWDLSQFKVEDYLPKKYLD